MKKTHIIVLIILVILGIVYFTNYRNVENQIGNSDKTIKIGAVISLSGQAATFGEFAKNGMELAVKEINASSGGKGQKVEVLYEDDKTDPKSAVSAYKKLTSVDKVQAVVGGLWDFIAEPLFPLAKQNQLTFISPSNLRIKDTFEPNEQSFLMLPEFKTVLAKAEEFLKRDDVKKVAVVHFASTFGVEVGRAFDEMVNNIGKGPIINESYSQIGNNDFKTLISKLKDQNVDTLFIDMVDIDTVNFLKRAKELEFTPKIMTYVGSYDAFTDENKYLLEGITVLDWESSKPAFNDRYQKMYGTLPSKSAQRAYDAIYVLVNAILHTNSNSEVAKYIESHSTETPNNTIQFLSTHEVSSTDVYLKTYRNGVLVQLEN